VILESSPKMSIHCLQKSCDKNCYVYMPVFLSDLSLLLNCGWHTAFVLIFLVFTLVIDQFPHLFIYAKLQIIDIDEMFDISFCLSCVNIIYCYI